MLAGWTYRHFVTQGHRPDTDAITVKLKIGLEYATNFLMKQII
jgi:hypothetical protein